MKKLIPFVLLIVLSTTEAFSQSELNKRTIDSLMNLSFEEFDQNMQGGWRMYANNQDFKSATDLIKLYLEQHNELEAGQREVMSFHCGQLLALMDKNQEAIPYMKASKKTEDVMQWNIYVDATIAFLRKDREAFNAKKTELAQKSMMPLDQNKNLNVLNLLEANFESTYQEALMLKK